MDRPFEPTGMTTEKWKTVAPQRVRIADLVFCQEEVSIKGLIYHSQPGQPSFCGDSYPHVVGYAEKLWLSDGHHRVLAALLRGRKTILARVLRLQRD